MTTMMDWGAPMGARMSLRAPTTHISAGEVSLVVSTWEGAPTKLVMLPLDKDSAGQSVVGAKRPCQRGAQPW